MVQSEKSGHGQSSTIEYISDEFVEYALNLVAINIMLLIGDMRRKKRL